MMTTHAPPNEMLVDYASGAASPGVALLVAAHLTHSPESRRAVAEMEAAGGALLLAEAPAPLSDDALDAAMRAIEAEGAATPAAAPAPAGPLPRPVIDALGLPFESIPWRFRLPGLAEHEIAEAEGERISLVRARPGVKVPQHTHEGTELTLVLAGAMQDGEAVFRAGDLSIATEEHDHRPAIIGEETCYCLVVMQGRRRFTGPFSRALNMLGE